MPHIIVGLFPIKILCTRIPWVLADTKRAHSDEAKLVRNIRIHQTYITHQLRFAARSGLWVFSSARVIVVSYSNIYLCRCCCFCHFRAFAFILISQAYKYIVFFTDSRFRAAQTTSTLNVSRVSFMHCAQCNWEIKMQYTVSSCIATILQFVFPKLAADFNEIFWSRTRFDVCKND